MDTVHLTTHESNDPLTLIPCTKGRSAIVDVTDADLGAFKWHISKDYAVRRTGGRVVAMHRLILERKLQRPIQDGMMCDHINGQQLDNCRANLREVTLTQNSWNSGTQKNNTSGYTGVSFRQGYYVARIGSDGSLSGIYKTALDASFCYDRAALERWGEYARLNHPIEEVLAWQEPPHYLHPLNTSGYHGVTQLKRGGKWQASVKHRGKLTHVGTFDNADEAARAYDQKALELKGPKAIVNFPAKDSE